ncbi:metal-dependent hydrolase [Rubritalea tangerina]|uniref:Metal-dependent hydrolase n=1 Tax=Rubritalea tangerina TaxID=430798 RepID=A0ABW4Z616_9BACT
MNLTFYGHSCFAVEINGCKLLFDPFISPNSLAEKIDIDSIEADFILLSHGHEDHLADAEAILKRTGATLISNYEIVCWYGEKGITQSHPLNHGGSVKLPFGKVKFVNAVHSSVLPDGSYGGNPGGFVIESDEGNFYYSGDTALTYDMKLLGEFHKLDWAALSIGDNFTMGFEDAAICADWIGVDKILGVHYDTFPYITVEQAAARDHFAEKGKQLYLPAIGESINL